MAYVSLYHDLETIQRIKSGKAQFWIDLLGQLDERGHQVALKLQNSESLQAAGEHEDYAIVQKALTLKENVYSIRLLGCRPYLTVEKAGLRSEFRMARAKFQPDEEELQRLQKRCLPISKRVFKSEIRPSDRSPQGAILVPLQGQLLSRRSEDDMSAIEMLLYLRHICPEREIKYRLHPNYDYEKEELDALQETAYECALVRSTEDLDIALNHATLVASLNSTVALRGYFWHRPALFFGDIDFSHIGLRFDDGFNFAQRLAAFESEPKNFDAYLAWYFSQMAVFWPQKGPDEVISIMRALGFEG